MFFLSEGHLIDQKLSYWENLIGHATNLSIRANKSFLKTDYLKSGLLLVSLKA